MYFMNYYHIEEVENVSFVNNKQVPGIYVTQLVSKDNLIMK